MVDMQEEWDIEVWPDCAPQIRAAIAIFQSRWISYSDGGGRKRLGNLVQEIIEPAWRNYVASLPIHASGTLFCLDFEFKRPAGKRGFFYLGQNVKDLHRTVYSFNDLPTPHCYVLSDTLDTLLRLTADCENKKPLERSAGELSKRRKGWRETCVFCGTLTELEESLQGSKVRKNESKSGLSGRFCKRHRPMNHDGTWNSAYRVAVRHRKKFEEEVVRLSRAHSRHSLPRPSKDLMPATIFAAKVAQDLDSFGDEQLDVRSAAVRRLINQKMTCNMKDPDFFRISEHDARHAARVFVDSKITDRKKELIIYLEAGLSQSEIARRFGISRQAVSKMIKSRSFEEIPKAYRFDMRAAKRNPDL
ncbi:helix-turn-helix domain-containing protein [Granulicella sp. L60]|uniref:helix-turn-helix domain-containing protein n=1 Tax=Granulicella sp. L60 TaxID=1641866 RepID=UPI00131E1705|nr:helix-turn-helix domain-containing protein [Granulicella sp. L60]